MPRRLSLLSLTCTLALLGGLAARAQDFQREGPKMVPPVGQPGTVPNGASPTVAQDNQVLLKNLKALVFVASPKDVAAGGTKASGIELRNVQVPAPKKFLSLIHI